MSKNIFVTQPSLPPIDEYIPYLEKIWESKHLTNNGPFHKQLENELCDYLGVENIALFNNGTIALLTALQAYRLSGEVITTPYSFIATSHSLLWNNIKPVFVDIDKKTLNIDPYKIESAITNKTSAILAVHCYGNPCELDMLDKIANNYNLRLIYDAAHAFGVCDQHGSILNRGDMSVLSFHATKVFNTFEGGAIIFKDENLKQYINDLKNFGIHDEETVVATGINGKMNELSAAMGLLQLKYIDSNISKRKKVDSIYRNKLKDIKGINVLEFSKNIKQNYSYFPVLVGYDFPISRDDLFNKLKDNNINARKYFYPLISEFPMYRSLQSASSINLPNATLTASQVICLPMYSDIKISEIENIIEVITSFA